MSGASGGSVSQGGAQGRWRIYEQGGRAILELAPNQGEKETIVLTTDGSNLAAPQPGAANIEVFTAAPGGLAPGYQGSVFAPGADVGSAPACEGLLRRLCCLTSRQA